MPNVVSKELYAALKESQIHGERCKYLDTIARVFMQSGHADSLMQYGLRLSNNYKVLNTEGLINYKLNALYYQGFSASNMGLLDEAVKFFILGIESSDKNELLHKYIKLQLAQVYIFKGELDKAKQLLETLPQDKTDNAFYLKNIIVKSNFLLKSKDSKSARLLLNKGLSEDFLSEYDKLNLELRLGLVKTLIIEKKFSLVLEKLNSIKDESLINGFYDLYIDAAIYEGMAFANLKNYDIAEVALNSAYVNTIQWNRLELQQKIINALVKLYNAKEDYKNAYALMTQSRSINSAIIENQNQRLIKDLELKYETLKKEKKIDKLQEDQLVKEAEINRQKTIKYAFLIGFLVLLVPIILLLIVYYQKLQTQSLLNIQQESINQQEVKNLLQAQELELAKNAISVQAKERDRIARELHDSIGGNLAGIKLKMNSLGDHKPEFRQILNQLDATYDQVRDISHSLIPKEFETTAFTNLIYNYIKNISQNSSIDLRFEVFPKDVINAIDAQLQVAIFNMIKELVTNALKHANAKEIIIQLTAPSEEKSIELIYEDDGIGFDLDKVKKGIGINNIETRVADFNGTLSINTAINRGTVISISIPQT